MTDPSFDRVPPHNLEAERAVLGACLLDRDALLSVTDLLAGGDFYDQRHRLAYELILDMTRKDRAVDALTFWDEGERKGLLERLGGQPFIAGLVDAVTTTANAEHHARLVRDKAVHRRLIQVGGEIARLGYSESKDREETLDEAERLVFDIGGSGSTASIKPLRQVLGLTFRQIEERFHQGALVTGIPTGYDDFDRLTGETRAPTRFASAPATTRCSMARRRNIWTPGPTRTRCSSAAPAANSAR